MTRHEDTTSPAVGSPVDRGVRRLEPERDHACAQGCNGCDNCTDYDDYQDWVCDRCHGDDADP
jgi:hypothetical protein